MCKTKYEGLTCLYYIYLYSVPSSYLSHCIYYTLDQTVVVRVEVNTVELDVTAVMNCGSQLVLHQYSLLPEIRGKKCVHITTVEYISSTHGRGTLGYSGLL